MVRASASGRSVNRIAVVLQDWVENSAVCVSEHTEQLYRLTVHGRLIIVPLGGPIACPTGNRRNNRGHSSAYLDRSLAYASDFSRIFAAGYFCRVV